MKSLSRIFGIYVHYFQTCCWSVELPAGTVTLCSFKEHEAIRQPCTCVFTVGLTGPYQAFKTNISSFQTFFQIWVRSSHLALALNVPGLHDAGLKVKFVRRAS